MQTQRRIWLRGLALAGLGLAATPVLTGCGFALRRAPEFAFSTIFIQAAVGSSLATELKRSIAASGRVQVFSELKTPDAAQVHLELLTDTREKVVVGVNASGQVREFQLRTRLRFRLRNTQGRELIEPTELLQQRDISFNESVVLAKEAEEGLLYRDMQSDLVQQVMRRLAAVTQID